MLLEGWILMSTNTTDGSDKHVRANVTLKILILISAMVILIQVVVGYIVYLKFANWNERADFGEMFGAVNTLFSGLAFAGVIYAIFLQRRELELQRYELEMTREELRRTADAQEKSEKVLVEQAGALMLTARLNALNTLVQAYDQRLERQKFSNTTFILNEKGYQAEIKKLDEYVEKLEKLSNEMEQTSLDGAA